MRLLLTMLLLGACSREQGKAAAAQHEGPLEKYRRELRPLVALEGEALASVAAHTGERYTNDKALLTALREEALPRYRKLVTALKKVKPDEEAASFHARLVELMEAQLALLERLEKSVAAGNGTGVLLVNGEQRALRARMEALVRELEK